MGLRKKKRPKCETKKKINTNIFKFHFNPLRLFLFLFYFIFYPKLDTFYSERLVFMVYRPITIVGVAYKKGKKISITGNNQWIPSKFVVIFACFSLRTNLHSGIQLESFFVFFDVI